MLNCLHALTVINKIFTNQPALTVLDEEHPAVHVVRVLCKLGLGGRDSVRIDRHDSQVLTGLLFSNLLFLQLDGQVLTGLPLLFSSLLQLNLSLAAESTLSSIPLFPPPRQHSLNATPIFGQHLKRTLRHSPRL